VANGVAKEEWKNENWLRVIARLNQKSYQEMRVIVLEFLEADIFNLSALYDGYLRFTEEDLLQAFLKDGRFDVENPDDVFEAEVRVARKERGKREHRQR